MRQRTREEDGLLERVWQEEEGGPFVDRRKAPKKGGATTRTAGRAAAVVEIGKGGQARCETHKPLAASPTYITKKASAATNRTGF